MLRELRVRNLALIEDVHVPFGEGFHVVTGATGSGKSLLLAALDLLLGGRFSKELIRTGADDVRVEGLFDLEGAAARPVVAQILGDDAPELVLKRRVDVSGRNRCEANGSLVPVATLRELGRALVEIHGQSEHQALLEPAVQTALLDRAAGLVDRREAFAATLRGWHETKARLAELTTGADRRRARLEALDATALEIREVQLRAGELDELRNERALLADAERHAQAVAEAIGLVDGFGNGGDDSVRGGNGGDDAAGALDRLGRAARALDATSSLDPVVKDALDALEAAASAASDAVRGLREAADRIEANPARLEALDERIARIGHVLRRHGPGEDDALRALVDAEREAESLRGGDDDASSVAAKAAAEEKAVLADGAALDDARRAAGRTFADAVRASLAELGMPGTRFEVAVGRETDAAKATSIGLSGVEFLVSPNLGEELRAMHRIASGGELARIALSIRGELAGRDGVPLLVFDEIDADVGPRMGSVIGERLARLAHPAGPGAPSRQVLAVTHLAQVAALADRHLRVVKRTADGRTVSRVDVVEGGEREAELDEMRGEKRTRERTR